MTWKKELLELFREKIPGGFAANPDAQTGSPRRRAPSGQGDRGAALPDRRHPPPR